MTAHADAAPTSPLADVLESFFETKTACDVEGTMAYFSPDLASYIDATLGWDFDSYDALKGGLQRSTCRTGRLRPARTRRESSPTTRAPSST